MWGILPEMGGLGGTIVVFVAVGGEDQLVLRVFLYGKENQAHEQDLRNNGTME
jgi:hypothetical protein